VCWRTAGIEGRFARAVHVADCGPWGKHPARTAAAWLVDQFTAWACAGFAHEGHGESGMGKFGRIAVGRIDHHARCHVGTGCDAQAG